MINILETVERERKGFQPTTPDEFFALRLAERLGESESAKHYADLLSEHSVNTLLWLYQRAVSEGVARTAAGKRLHQLLAEHPHASDHYPCPRLLVAAVIRRAVAVALLSGTHLERVTLRHLPADPRKAEFSAAGFLGTTISECRFDSAAIEMLPELAGTVRTTLHAAVVDQLRSAAVPIWETEITAVTQAFAHTVPQTRKHAREIVAAIWPLSNGGNTEAVMLDALALGLYVQTERMFTSPV